MKKNIVSLWKAHFTTKVETAINLYRSNSLAAKFTKQKSFKMQGELHEKKKNFKGNFNRTEGSRQRIWRFPEELAADV